MGAPGARQRVVHVACVFADSQRVLESALCGMPLCINEQKTQTWGLERRRGAAKVEVITLQGEDWFARSKNNKVETTPIMSVGIRVSHW